MFNMTNIENSDKTHGFKKLKIEFGNPNEFRFSNMYLHDAIQFRNPFNENMEFLGNKTI